MDLGVVPFYNRIRAGQVLLPRKGTLRHKSQMKVPSNRFRGGLFMKNPLDSLLGTVISGVIITVILYFVANLIMPHVAAGGGA